MGTSHSKKINQLKNQSLGLPVDNGTVTIDSDRTMTEPMVNAFSNQIHSGAVKTVIMNSDTFGNLFHGWNVKNTKSIFQQIQEAPNITLKIELKQCDIPDDIDVLHYADELHIYPWSFYQPKGMQHYCDQLHILLTHPDCKEIKIIMKDEGISESLLKTLKSAFKINKNMDYEGPAKNEILKHKVQEENLLLFSQMTVSDASDEGATSKNQTTPTLKIKAKPV